MAIRDNLGRFKYGSKFETQEEKTKRITSLREAQRRAPKYLGELKHSPLYTIWRGFMFTKKTKAIGTDTAWKNFKNFYNDMSGSYQKGLRLGRLNKNLPFSLSNCVWMTDSELSFTKRDALTLKYKGEVKLLVEWATIFELPYNGVKQRYCKGKNYTEEEILFGKRIAYKKPISDIKSLSEQKQRDKISKMISSYHCRDKKKSLKFDLDREWLREFIIDKPCIYCGDLDNVGCDRVDNKLGHTKDNVVPACYICNTVRNNLFSVEEMRRIGKLIADIKKRRVFPQATIYTNN